MSLCDPLIPEVARPWFWKYVLEHPVTWEKFWCRWRGHPHGQVFYNVSGLEPDDRCIDCGDHI